MAKGVVPDLADKGFSLGGTPFSIFMRRKGGTVESDTTIGCRLICDTDFGELPVVVGDWTPALIAELAPNAFNAEHYEAYWGASEKPTKQ